MRLGISTGGGDCPGLNAVIRAVVRTAILSHGWEVVGIQDGLRGLIEPDKVIPLDLQNTRGILHLGGTILGSTSSANPFNYTKETEQGVVEVDISGQVMDRAEQLGIDAMIFIGGDGTQYIAQRFSAKGMRVIGVPKTIDNDVLETDSTFGFDSAVGVAVDAIGRLHTTAESHSRVMILEVMGRDAGWIALHSGVAGGADVILLPELAWTWEGVTRKLDERRRSGSNFSIIVVAEGALLPDMGAVVMEDATAGRARRLKGVSVTIEEELRAKGYDSRATILGHLQRGGSPTPTDRLLGTRFGVHAVELAAAGRFGRMVRLNGCEVDSIELTKVAGDTKSVPADDELIRAAKAIGISFGE